MFCWELGIQVTLTDRKRTHWCGTKFPKDKRGIFGVLSKGLMFIELWLWGYIDCCERGCVHTAQNKYTRRLQTTRKSWFFLPWRSQGWNSSRRAWGLFQLRHITGPYCISSKKKKIPTCSGLPLAVWIPHFILVAPDSSEKIARSVCFAFPGLELQEPAWAFSFLKEFIFSHHKLYYPDFRTKKDSNS